MGRTACTEPQCLYNGVLYLTSSMTGMLFLRKLLARLPSKLRYNIRNIRRYLQITAFMSEHCTLQLQTAQEQFSAYLRSNKAIWLGGVVRNAWVVCYVSYCSVCTCMYIPDCNGLNQTLEQNVPRRCVT